MGLDSKVKARMTSAIEREATIKVKKMIKWFINSFLDKNVVVPPGAVIGVDPEADRARGFLVTEGLTVLGKDQPFPG